MKTRLQIGSIAAIACLAMPFLCRLPKGSGWLSQYIPDEGHFISGTLFFGAFAAIPAVLVFCAALVSKPRFYFPSLLSTTVALILLAYWHHNNDLASDAQAAISLVFIPIYVAAASAVAGLLGLLIQALSKPNKPEQADAVNRAKPGV